MNDTYTIIKELQAKNKASLETINKLALLWQDFSNKNQKLESDRKRAVELLEIVEFKTNKRFENEVKKAIKILESNE